jgi:hypothetical protein
MSQNFQPGDYLIFQLESGYGVLRLLGVEESHGDRTWHVAAFSDLFLDPEMVDLSLQNPGSLTLSHPHIALTNRAFESTQVARMANFPLTENEVSRLDRWRENNGEVSDRSIRLMLGLR